MMFFVKLNNFIFFTPEYQLDSENWRNALFRILFYPIWMLNLIISCFFS